MAWRAQGMTGSNNVPLGNRRRFGGDRETSADTGFQSPATPSGNDVSDYGQKRGRSPARAADATELASDGTKRRKKRNRWGEATENKAAGLMNLPTAIMANMTSEQLEAYTLHLRIEEISQKLRINDVVPADGDRSPSPPPQYDNAGRRVNTREYRYRKRLEDERHKLIERAIKVIPDYHAPSDYRRPTKTQEKVYVPVNDYPEINFIGLLIGPRGNTLKTMESESGAKIAIRGKGSVKEGKGRSDAAHTSNQEEDLHCLIMADTEEKINKAKRLIHNVIETAASIPEGQNELKRNQLRELATLNGTLRDDENQACQNCGEIGHRKYDCPHQRNYTANITCRLCGNAGHMARDCPDRQRGASWRNNDRNDRGGHGGRANHGGDVHDQEYESLMQELSGGAPIANSGAPQRIEAGRGDHDGHGHGHGGREPKPWQRGPTGAPAPWQRAREDRESGQSARPWASGGRNDSHGFNHHGSYQNGFNNNSHSHSNSSAPGAAPWHQNMSGAQQSYQGYTGYQGYGANSSFPQAPGMGAPPGIGAPPGMPGQYSGYGAGSGAPPPPPPGDAPPPPPPGDAPPPPPPSDQPPPPPPPGN